MTIVLSNKTGRELSKQLLGDLNNILMCNYNNVIDYAHFHYNKRTRMLLLEVVYKGRVFKSACKSQKIEDSKMQTVIGILSEIKLYEKRPTLHNRLLAMGDHTTVLEYGVLPKHVTLVGYNNKYLNSF